MNHRRRTALYFLVLIAAFLIISALFTVIEAGHECDGADCEICFYASVVNCTIKSLLVILFAAGAVWTAVDHSSVILYLPYAKQKNETPVLLKVKISE